MVRPVQDVALQIEQQDARFQAMSLPTMIVMRDGQVVNRLVGALPKPALAEQIVPHLKPPKQAAG